MKPKTDTERRSGSPMRLIGDPVEHQGVRNALRKSFDCGRDMPDEFQQLLRKLH